MEAILVYLGVHMGIILGLYTGSKKVVSPKRRDPNIDQKSFYPHYGNSPKEGTPIYGKSSYRFKDKYGSFPK